MIKAIPKKEKCKNGKWLSEEGSWIAEKKEVKWERRSQDGGGIGPGDHFLPDKFIKRTFKC